MFYIFLLQIHFLGQVHGHLAEARDQMSSDPDNVSGGQPEVVEAVSVSLGQLPGVGVGDAQAAVPVVSGAARVPPPTITSL